MGIFGLYNFIQDNYSKYLKSKHLSHQKIVFDGQNIVFSIIRSAVPNVSFVNGGDYESIANALDKFMAKLTRCEIEAIFVFDGINTQEYNIWEKVKQRNAKIVKGLHNKDERSEVRDKMYVGEIYKYPNLLALDVALSTIRKANFTILQTDEGAQGDIIAIARELNCLILTGNADFFFYDEPGIVYSISPHESIQANWIDESDTLRVVEWCVEDFRRDQGLTKYDMALFGAVASYFYANGRFNDYKNIFERVKSICQTTVEKEKEQIIFDKFTTEIDHDFDAFKLNVNGFRNSDFNSETYSQYEYLLSNTASLCTFKKKCFPEKYQEMWRRRKLPPYLANVLCVGKLKLPYLLQNTNMPSAYQCSRAIRQVSYAIMLQYDYEGKRNISDKNYPVEFYRHGGSFVEPTIEPVFRLSDLEQTPSLEDIPQLSDLDRKDVFFASLSTSPDIVRRMSLPDDVQMFLAVLRYWSKNSTATIFHIQAMILCFIKTRLMDQYFERDDKCAVDTFNCTTAHLEEVKHQFNQIYERLNSVQDEITFLDRIAELHPFSELQAVLLDAMHLNQLLLSPFGDFLVQHYFSGTFLISMTILLRDERVNVQRLLKNASGKFLLDLFEKCNEIIG